MAGCRRCAADNPPGARFCASCGASLPPACAQCGTELPAGARFCPSCGTPQAEPVPAGRERRIVTVLFADVAGFTSLGERLDPEHLQDVLASYFAAMRNEIEAEGGTVEKFIGDAVMAVFGVPVAHEDDPARALRAALRMRRRLGLVNEQLEDRHGVRLEIRIGVTTGDVVAAIDPQPGEPMVTGDAVNAAARLEQIAEPGQVVVADRTARATRGFRFEDLGEIDVRGKDRPIRSALLLGEETVAPERGVPGLRAPMVGRDPELELLEAIYERTVEDGRPNLVTIYGEPGVGKSRLTAEFIAVLQARDPRPNVLHGRCLPYGEGVTYWPLAEILKGHAGILDTDPPDAVLKKIRSAGTELITREHATSPLTAAAALAYTVGVEDRAIDWPSLGPREVRLKIHAAWRSYFSAMAARAPVVIVIEDIHWADPALLDLLEDLADRAEGSVLILCPSRPDLSERRAAWGGGRRNFTSLGLDPLSHEDADRLVTLLLSIEDLPDAVHERILERAEGNPFFLEEIVRHLIDEGLIVRQDERWRAAPSIGDIEIPDTVQAVLAARIDLLGAAEKRALQGAAVVGRVFWPAPVGLLLNGKRSELEDILERLEARELVVSRLRSTIAGQPEFAFKHVLTRDVAYGALSRRDRARAHATVAGWIEDIAGERRGESVELLAYHYEEAYRADRDDPRGDRAREEELRAKALHALLTACADALRRYAVRKAVALSDRALSLVSGPLERAEALEQQGLSAIADYQGDRAWASLREAADLLTEHSAGDRHAIARVCARAVEVPLRWPGSMTAAPEEREVRRYLDLGLARVGDEETSTHARLLTAVSFGPFAFAPQRGTTEDEVAAASEAGFRAAETATRIGRPDLASAALDGASSAYVTLGHYGRGLSIVERRLELAKEIEDPWELGDIYAVAAWQHIGIGEYPPAREYADRGRALLESGLEGTTIHCHSWAALAEFLMGNWDAVVGELFPQIEALLGDRRHRPPYFTQNAFGASAFVLDARGDAAADRLVGILADMADPGRQHEGVEAWLGWIHLRRGRMDEAREHLEASGAAKKHAYRFFVDAIRAIELAEMERWDEVPPFLADSRAYSAEAALRALPVHLDRLDGRAALAAGDLDRAVRLLSAACTAFEGLSARWERACTDLSLAEALLEDGRAEEARSRLDTATGVLEDLRSQRELTRSRELLTKLE